MGLHQLLQPPHWLTAHQRRSWRILAWTNLLLALATLLWVPLLWRDGDSPGAGLYALFCVGGLVGLELLRRGRWRWCVRWTISCALVFALTNAVWINPVVLGQPRSAHQYLLALGVVSVLMTRDDVASIRYGFPALCLACYALLAGSDFTLHVGPPVTQGPHVWGAWFDQIVSVAVVFLALHVLQTDSVRLDGLAADLKHAIEGSQLALHYQPQVDACGRVLGAEALLRWQHPRHGAISPAEFVPLAERHGLMPQLGHWVLRQACVQLAQWTADPLMRPLVLAVNVSAQQFDLESFVPRLMRLLAEHEVAPQRLKLELTETALARDIEAVIRKMQTLRRRGVALALDDFGTGFSSLSQLRRLPLDQLKIDQSFVQELGRGAEGEAIARAIVAMGSSLGMDVIAEGVETPQHKDALARMGCRHYQGYLFARPMPAPELREWLLNREDVSHGDLVA